MILKYYPFWKKLGKITFWICFILFIPLSFLSFWWPTILLGSSFLLSSAMTLIFQFQLKKYGLTTTGKVCKYITDSDNNPSAMIQFTTLDHVPIEALPAFSSSYSITGFGYKNMIGKEVEVLYYSEHPSAFIVKPDFSMNILMTLLFMLAGAAALTWGVWNLWFKT